MTTETYVDPPTVEQPDWLTPEEVALAEALIKAVGRLRDAGYKVSNGPGARTIEAEFTVGDRHARVSLIEGRYWLIERHQDHDDGRRIVVDEEWPVTLAAAVRRAVKLAGELAKAHDAEQAPAVIGDAVFAAHDAVAEVGAA